MIFAPFTINLENSRSALIREVGPQDKELLKVGFEQLSKRSRYFRFLGAHPTLSAREVESFTAKSDGTHVAVGALLVGHGDTSPAGIARYVRLETNHHKAEFAVTVVDAHQGLGLGSLLLGVLAKCAVLNGIGEFVSIVHAENHVMSGLVDQLGGDCKRVGKAEVQFSFPLFKDAASYPATKVGDAFRTAHEHTNFC